MGFYLRKKETGHAGGRAVLCWARVWLCWARWAGFGVEFGRAGRAGLGLVVGFGSAGRAGLGWAWNLAVLGALGWVGRGIWLCWARWAGLGAELAFYIIMVYIVHFFFMPS